MHTSYSPPGSAHTDPNLVAVSPAAWPPYDDDDESLYDHDDEDNQGSIIEIRILPRYHAFPITTATTNLDNISLSSSPGCWVTL